MARRADHHGRIPLALIHAHLKDAIEAGALRHGCELPELVAAGAAGGSVTWMAVGGAIVAITVATVKLAVVETATWSLSFTVRVTT